MASTSDKEQLLAVAMANQVFDTITRIEELRNYGQQLMKRHGDKQAFKDRLAELVLGTLIERNLSDQPNVGNT